MLDRVNEQVRNFKKSGIRRFAEAASMMEDVVSLTLGEPEFNTDESVKQAAIDALNANQTHYPVGQGLYALRQAVSTFEAKNNQMDYKPEEVIITNGSTEGLAATFLALLNPGDEVIIPEPMYVTYRPMIEYCKAKLVVLDTTHFNFQIDEDALRALVTDKTKLIVITSPNNPTGVVYTRNSIQAITRVVKENRLFVISDDVYHQLIYTDSFVKLSDDPELRPNLIVAQSFSKPYAMTGWRIGYLMADQPIATIINAMHAYLVTGIATFVQLAAIKALDVDPSPMREAYRQRRDRCLDLLSEMKLDTIRPEGAFYLFVDIHAFGMDSETFCLKALHEYRVAIVPGIFFGQSGDRYIRISYAVPENELYEGLSRLKTMVLDLRSV